MSKAAHPKPVLDILDPRDLELGPFAAGAARDEASPWKHWRMRTDEDGIAWLLFDKQDASANTLDDETLTELDAGARQARTRPSARAGDPLGQAWRLRRRRRHRAVPPHHRHGADRGAADARPRHARPARPPAAADRRGDPRLLPRRRTRAGAGLRQAHRHRRRELRLSRGAARPASGPRRHGAAAAPDQPGPGDDHDADRQDRARAAGQVARPGRCGDAGAPCPRRREGCRQRRAEAASGKACSTGCSTPARREACSRRGCGAKPPRRRRRRTTPRPMR